MSLPAFSVVTGCWDRLREDASEVRFQVFVVEQKVPADIEMDDRDPVCVHAVAYDAGGLPLGTGRLLPDGHIGRMAVHKHARGMGVGGLILQALVEAGRKAGHATLALNAQTHAQGFYAAHGFVAQDGEFMEAGIPHVTMTRVLGV